MNRKKIIKLSGLLIILILLFVSLFLRFYNLKQSDIFDKESEYIEHILQNGDSCGSIAVEYDVPIDSLIEYNELSSNCNLSDVSIIKIPLISTYTPDFESRPIIDCAIVWHTVHEQESLLEISLQYGVHIEIIKNWNGKTKDIVVTDERLLIPLCPS